MIEIKSRSGVVLWTSEAATLREALEQAVAAGADLIGANLTRANLTAADLTGAKLPGANLTGAKLPGANLTGAKLPGVNLANANLANANLRAADLTGAKLANANLTNADLPYAKLPGANLTGAKLPGANLTGANLTGADLPYANLTNANLTYANLTGVNLTNANLANANLPDWLAPIRSDLRSVLDSAPNEVEGLAVALLEGRVDGSTYEGPCACLVGTLANVRGCALSELGINADSSRPAEQWFLKIRPGLTPSNSVDAAVALGWIREWQSERRLRTEIP